MALTVEKNSNDGLYYMSGLTQKNDPYPIGRHYFRVGQHHVGFDDGFSESLAVKAFYDPDGVVGLPDFHYIGYMQFMELSFVGHPIPPQVYGGQLADRAPYACGEDHGYVFADFMEPHRANLLKPPDDSFEPFYPYNGMLSDGTVRSRVQLSWHPRANGSFLLRPVLGETQSRAASLFADVPLSLITESDVRPLLSDDNLLDRIPVTPQNLAEREPYQLALDYLIQPGRLLEGLTPEHVSGQVLGNLVLITLPDSEDFTPTLCVTLGVRDGRQCVLPYLISYYDMASMRQHAVAQALERVHEFTSERGINIPSVGGSDVESGRPPRRGGSGLMMPKFDLKPDEGHFKLRCSAVAVAATRYMPSTGRTKTRPINGFTWTAVLSYDEDTQSLNLIAIRAPELVEAFDYETPVGQFLAALDNPALNVGEIDMSNFTKAAMRRQNFGAAVRPDYIDSDGEIIII